ncbi:MAG: hypothetical protein ACSLFK_09275 [Gemmatimonadaceae bacterium]
MNTLIFNRFFRIAVISAIAGGCSTGQQSALPTEKDRAAAERLGLTQLPVAPAVRRIWTGAVDFQGHPSADGRFFSMTDWTTGDVALYDLTTHTKRAVTTRSSDDASSDFAETSVISPDGTLMAFGWYAEKTHTWELRIAGLTGADSGKVRTVYSSSGEFVGAQAWTPNGAEVIAAVSPAIGRYQIAAIDARDGRTRILRSVDWRYPSNLTVSPNGLWLAYDFPSDDTGRDVHVMGIDGLGDNTVARYRGDDIVMGWTASDDRLLILSDRSGTPSVWALTIEDGKAVGNPLLVRSNLWRAFPVATSGGGPKFYAVMTGERDVFSVPIDPSTSVITSKGVSLSEGVQNINPQAFGWSADGEQVAYIQRRGSQYLSRQEVVIKSVKRGNLRLISPRMSQMWKLHWFHDGRALLLIGADDKGQRGIFRMDIASGAIMTLLNAKPGDTYPRALAFSRDGKRIVYFTTEGNDLVVNELDAVRGGASTLRRVKGASLAMAMAFSPDGRNLAMAVGNKGLLQNSAAQRVIVAAIDGGSEREVYRPGPTEQLTWTGLAWTLDGRNLIFGVRSKEEHALDDVRRLSLETGQTESIGLRRQNIMAMAISPDGRTLLYGVSNGAWEMWTMDAPVFPGATLR